jgi:hypothetical protein
VCHVTTIAGKGTLHLLRKGYLRLRSKLSILLTAGVTAIGRDKVTGRAPSITTEDRPQMHDTFSASCGSSPERPATKKPANE